LVDERQTRGPIATTDPRRRPSSRRPDARRRGHTGRLKIFVGAAPGVGKTYEMLETARAKLNEGVDVVVGLAEAHGRKETDALLEGFEVLPRKPMVYVNRILDEFDIIDQWVLNRAPGERQEAAPTTISFFTIRLPLVGTHVLVVARPMADAAGELQPFGLVRSEM
jgi:Osmosensitive K+ channel His kinase sensor domain